MNRGEFLRSLAGASCAAALPSEKTDGSPVELGIPLPDGMLENLIDAHNAILAREGHLPDCGEVSHLVALQARAISIMHEWMMLLSGAVAHLALEKQVKIDWIREQHTFDGPLQRIMARKRAEGWTSENGWPADESTEST